MLRQPMAVRRYTGGGQVRPRHEVPVVGHARALGSAELVGAIQQGDQQVIVMASDLIAGQMPPPITVADKVFLQGRELSIISVAARKAPDGTVIAYELTARG